jgi:hypothetical protein
LATVASWLNGETTRIALDQITIDEHSQSEANDQRLLIDQSV